MITGTCSQLLEKDCHDTDRVALVKPLKERVEFDIELTEGNIKAIEERYVDWPEVLEALKEEIIKRQKAGSMKSAKEIAADLAKAKNAKEPPSMEFFTYCENGSVRNDGRVRINS